MKFVDQQIKLIVENIDPPTTRESRHGALLPNTCRALVVGPSGCDVDGVQLFTFHENDEVIPPEKALPDSVFIFDDILCENQNIQDETNLKHVYMEHCSGDMNYPEFKEFCTLCWSKGRFNFVVISKDCERDNGRYRHEDDSTVLNELVIAKENIKRKFEALKRGDADIQSYVSQTFKPIIEPLNKLHNQSPTTQTSEAGNDNDISNAIEDLATDNRTGTYRSLEECEKDKIYGPRKKSDGVIKLGHEEVKFKNNEIIINDSSYQLTPGLVELLYSRYPMQYTDSDLNTYKSILIQTSAHLTLDGTKMKHGGAKYKQIICKLFSSGTGVQLQKHNLVYWNDSNELVDRLRLLLASQSAGNTEVSNEILSIFEELYESVTGAMSKILISRSPKLLQVDNGKEFYNLKFDMLMTKHNIKKYSTYSTTKACFVERFNRTLKTNMYREFTAQGSHKWLSILPILTDNYNNSKHRTIGMTPVQAEENPALLTLKQRTIVNRKVKFHVGDKVRISTQKGVFTKGFLPNWSTEIFTIVKINKTEPPTYQLHHYHDEPIAGCFYTEEISKTNFPNDYLIEKIIRKKGNQIYVKWIGQQQVFY
ncbi:hypothetical protein AGLY_002658 [Aphis glycines]|uniref:Integrase catalytic domain-containing protein n=1 Tax=Aphis glycines TaxID=307491 RepID=A0A6G0U1A4_APHGL|nr:hypothetical protein AGLY_002658 [Aphis glycines]